uniref:Uncharacterized protein n=1 Tax=Anguilla anguilla TaxID=7936 RepID=A0A0E9PU94_ANGAN
MCVQYVLLKCVYKCIYFRNYICSCTADLVHICNRALNVHEFVEHE